MMQSKPFGQRRHDTCIVGLRERDDVGVDVPQNGKNRVDAIRSAEVKIIGQNSERGHA